MDNEPPNKKQKHNNKNETDTLPSRIQHTGASGVNVLEQRISVGVIGIVVVIAVSSMTMPMAVTVPVPVPVVVAVATSRPTCGFVLVPAVRGHWVTGIGGSSPGRTVAVVLLFFSDVFFFVSCSFVLVGVFFFLQIQNK